jgi:phospholipid/cholesterol/gamma-HCH transport system substrate-binding protein
MLRLTPEAKVGLFVILGIIILVFMSLKVGGIRLGRAEGYELYVKFDSAAGLDKDVSVQVAGVEVGRVKDITLEDNKAKVVIMMNKGVKIGSDFVAVLTTQGVLGERYIELIPGSPNAPIIEPGGEITRTKTYTDIEKFITIMSDVSSDIKEVSRSFASVFGGVEGEATLKDIVVNIRGLTDRINKVLAANDEKIGRTMDNFERFSQLLREEGPKIAGGLRDITDNLNQVIAENRGALKESIGNFETASLKLEETMDAVNRLVRNVEPKIDESISSIKSIAEKIDKGEGTIAKLLNDPTTHKNINEALSGINDYIGRMKTFKVFLGYRGEYLGNADDTKSYFSLRLQPKPDRYYLVEVVDDPRGSRSVETKDVTEGGTTTTTKEVKTADEFKFSAQIAKRFGDLTLRGGILESTGGVGMDYYLWDDNIKFSFEAFDFDEERNPHLKVGLTYNLNKYFFITGGYDDFVSKIDLETYFLGAGFQFEDEDIKYLLGSIPIPR